MSVAGFPGGSARTTSARRVAGVLAVAETVGIAVAVTLIAATVILGRPVSVVDVLLVPGVPLLVARQLRAILHPKASKTRGSGRRYPASTGTRPLGGALRAVLGPADRRVRWTVATLGVFGWLSVMTSVLFLTQGGPAGPGGGCSYRVVNHGVDTYVSKSAYDLAGAAQQRLVAGIFLFFFAIHLYAALGRRNPADYEATGPPAGAHRGAHEREKRSL